MPRRRCCMSSPPATTPAAHGSRARPDFERIALLLQGGGALGSYQAGVYQALLNADLHPDWVAGISIGAINAALIAGNPPERRVERLRAFWETVTEPPLGVPYLASVDIESDMQHQLHQPVPRHGHHAVGRAELLQAAHAAALSSCRQATPRQPSLLRHLAPQRDARAPRRFRPHQCQARCASASAR